MNTHTLHKATIIHKGWGIWLVILISFFSISSSSCSSVQDLMGKKEEKKKDDAKKLKIALIPFDFSFVVGAVKAKEAYEKFADILVKNKTFQASSMKEWMAINFMNVVTRKSLDDTKPPEIARFPKAQNIKEIISLAKQKGLEIDMFCHGKLFKAGRKNGIIITIYSLKNEVPHYFYRSFLNYDQLGDILQDITNEMTIRFKNNTKPLFDRHVFIENFNIKFYTYTRLKSGEESIINLPYINIGGISYKVNDRFFQEMLLYNMHTMQLCHIWNSNMAKYIVRKPTIPDNMNYVVSVDIDISDTTSLLTAHIYNKAKNKKVSFQLPFDSLEIDDLFATMRLFGMNIMMHALGNNDLRKIGVLQINSVDINNIVFLNNFFLGYGNQRNLLLPAGVKDIVIGDEKYRTFVSPYTVNDKIYDLKRSFLLKFNK